MNVKISRHFHREKSLREFLNIMSVLNFVFRRLQFIYDDSHFLHKISPKNSILAVLTQTEMKNKNFKNCHILSDFAVGLSDHFHRLKHYLPAFLS